MNRQLAGLAAILSVSAVLLATRYQTFTHVAIDGRTIRMLIGGRGHATVVFENGYGAPLETWGLVQPKVNRFAKTVTYDRAGFGLSDDGRPPRNGRRIAEELRRALRSAGIPPPYILVGHSLGGPYIRVFAGLYPHEIAGMVLVDPVHDGDNIDEPDLPELSSLPETIEQARASTIPAGIPLVLIDARGWRDVPFATAAIRERRAAARSEHLADSLTYRRWLATVPGSRHVVTELSGHNVPQEQPELIVDTIREVVQATTPRPRLR